MQLLFALRRPVSRCSLKFHRFLYLVTHYTVFGHLALVSLMNKINERNDSDEGNGKPGLDMPADFGLPTAIFIVIAGMVGTGVLTTSGFTVLDVGSNQWMLWLWLLGGITAFSGALTLAELSAAIPKTGGDYVYVYEAFGPLPAFLSGWVSFLIGFAVPSAASAFAFAKYTIGPLKLPGSQRVYYEQVLATGALLAFAIIHVSSRARTAQRAGIDHVLEALRASRVRVRRAVHRLAEFCQSDGSQTGRRCPSEQHDVFDGVRILRLYGLEFGGVSGGRGPRCRAPAAVGDSVGNGGRNAFVSVAERGLRPGIIRDSGSGRCGRPVEPHRPGGDRANRADRRHSIVRTAMVDGLLDWVWDDASIHPECVCLDRASGCLCNGQGGPVSVDRSAD